MTDRTATFQRRVDEARSLFHAGDVGGAVAIFAQLVEAQPGRPELLGALAAGQFRLGRYSEAEATYRQVLAQVPTSYEAAHFLAVSLERQGRKDEAALAHRAAERLKAEALHAIPGGGSSSSNRSPAPGQSPGGPYRDGAILRLARGRVTVQGQAFGVPSKFNMWQDILKRSVNTFVVRPAGGGAPVVVEMRGQLFLGRLGEGDSVEVTGTWRGDTVRAKRLRNISTNTIFRARSYRPVTVPLLVLFLASPLVAALLWVPRYNSAEPSAVPDVTGETTFFARESLDHAGLVPVVVEEPSEAVPAGRAIRTEPAGGTPRRDGATVTVYVSTGSTTVLVPEVRGKEGFFAERDIEKVGLIPSRKDVADGAIPARRAVRTDPPAGTPVAKGTVVTLYVATGR